MALLHYRPNETADRCHIDQRHQIHALVGPWGCGKSQAAIWDVYLYQDRHPTADVLVVRDTYSALKDSCVEQWMRTFGDYGTLSGGQIPDFTWSSTVRSLQTGEPMTGVVKFRAAQEEWQVQKFLSMEVGMAWLEEATPGITAGGQLSQGLPPGLFAGIWARCRQVKDERRLILTSSPPPNDQHWFYRIFYEKKPLVDLENVEGEEFNLLTEKIDWPTILSTVQLWELSRTENLEHLPPGYYESLLPFLKTEDQLLRFYHGRVPKGSYGGYPVYSSWRDAIHLAPGLTAAPGSLIRSWDGGLTPACVWLQVPQEGGVRVLAELQGKDEGLSQFIPRALTYGLSLFGSRPALDYGDPAIGIRSQNDRVPGTQIFKDHGLNLRPGIQDPFQRVQAVRSWLGNVGFFQMHPRCTMLLAGFRGAYKRKMIGGVPSEIPDKDHDPESTRHSHLMNALEYAATRLSTVAQTEKVIPFTARQLEPLGRWPGQTPAVARRYPHRFHRKGAA